MVADKELINSYPSLETRKRGRGERGKGRKADTERRVKIVRACITAEMMNHVKKICLQSYKGNKSAYLYHLIEEDIKKRSISRIDYELADDVYLIINQEISKSTNEINEMICSFAVSFNKGYDKSKIIEASINMRRKNPDFKKFILNLKNRVFDTCNQSLTEPTVCEYLIEYVENNLDDFNIDL